jgi:hypothetical protein
MRSGATLASDGLYLYLHDIYGLLKIGTGKANTVQVHSPSFHSNSYYFIVIISFSYVIFLSTEYI